jgi:hypothetical protein
MPGSAHHFSTAKVVNGKRNANLKLRMAVLIASTLRYLISGPPINQPTNDGQDDDGYDLVCIARAMLRIYCSDIAPAAGEMPLAAWARYAEGAKPVQRLKARLKALASEYPKRNAISVSAFLRSLR